MTTPFDRPATVATTPASESQRDFVAVLSREAAAMARLSGDVARAAMVEGADFSAVFADSKATSAKINAMIDANKAYRTEHGVVFADQDREVQRRADEVAGTVRAAAGVVPAGRYAIELDGVLGFFKVDAPTEGKWAGRVFVKQLASDDEYPVRGARRDAVLAAIATDPMAASVAYGREIGRCGVCNRTLTDADSRAAGIGPICASRM